MVSKLKQFKIKLKEINKEGFNNLQATVGKYKQELDDLQTKLQHHPLDTSLITQEKEARERLITTQKNYAYFLQQKAKIAWLQDGDCNTAFLHSSIKQRMRQNQILSIEQLDGSKTRDPNLIAVAFLEFYKGLLSTRLENRRKVHAGILAKGPKLTQEQTNMLLQEFPTKEVKAAVFSIPGSKSPGPDGFFSFFYQDNWEIIGKDVSKVVLPFLNSDNIIKEINSTIITLVPKRLKTKERLVKFTLQMDDYCSLCNRQKEYSTCSSSVPLMSNAFKESKIGWCGEQRLLIWPSLLDG
uniref:Reverse transcriptase n=1 Tax=Cannabis sativa TaxID=3483 RepID=A0A803PUJ5_CANSA